MTMTMTTSDKEINEFGTANRANDPFRRWRRAMSTFNVAMMVCFDGFETWSRRLSP